MFPRWPDGVMAAEAGVRSVGAPIMIKHLLSTSIMFHHYRAS